MRKRSMASFSVGYSRAGRMRIPSRLSLSERCVSGSKKRIESTSVSKKSMRQGCMAPIGKTSRMEPRMENSPCSITVSTARWPESERKRRSSSGSRSSPFLMMKELLTMNSGGGRRCRMVSAATKTTPFFPVRRK